MYVREEPSVIGACKHSVSVAAVITDPDGRALGVQRRDNGKWEIPGGILELDESIYAGLDDEEPAAR
jgi:8-oxo-dGTP diphosphatase